MSYHQQSFESAQSDISRPSKDRLNSGLVTISDSLFTGDICLKTDEITDTSDTSATILIVDDTPDILKVLSYCLETAGFKVLTAEDGEKALQIARSQLPDLILLDVVMPDLNGFAICDRLKARTSTREIPIIFLTGRSETVDKVRGFKSGGVDYVTKPIEHEELLARIQTHLNLRSTSHILKARNQELKQALDFETLIRRTSDKIRDRLDEDYCWQTATEELTTVFNLIGCQVELYDSEQTTATIVYEHSPALPSYRGETRRIDDFPELNRQLLQGIPLQLAEHILQNDAPGIKITRLACPIFDDYGMLGNLWVFRPSEELFTFTEVRHIQQVAERCAIAIRQARQYASSNQQVAELIELNLLKDDLIEHISRELKAPTSSIQLAAQTLESILKTKPNVHRSPLFKRVMQIFYESCQRQTQLTDDLLTVCSPDARTKIQPKAIALNSWLANLVETQDRPKPIFDLSTEVSKIYADPIILEHIVLELLSSAYKNQGVNGKIILQTLAAKSEVSLCIISQTPYDSKISQAKLDLLQSEQIPNNLSTENAELRSILVKRLAEIIDATVEVQVTEHQTTFCLKFASN